MHNSLNYIFLNLKENKKKIKNRQTYKNVSNQGWHVKGFDDEMANADAENGER